MPSRYSTKTPPDALSLAETALATGIAPDLLRVWERRYGFPSPGRDRQGHRLFPTEQVERLRLIRRLIDGGARPSQVVALSAEALNDAISRGLAPDPGRAGSPIGLDADVAEALRLLEEENTDRLARHLNAALMRRGAGAFVIALAAPLTGAVGEAWQAGRLSVFQEHAYVHAMSRVLGRAAEALAVEQGPRVLLTTVPGEAHGLGLAMVEVLLALEGCVCVGLGLQTPVEEIAAAALHHRVDAVALSFSSFFQPRRAVDLIAQLRGALAPETALWVGGSCAGLRNPLAEGASFLVGLPAIAAAVAGLREGSAKRSE
ncbi:MAG: hypothetical protein RIS94_1461 [Pseudomonadota bacterium]|jgi:methanogenic corrinoid protein MtbC1